MSNLRVLQTGKGKRQRLGLSVGDYLRGFDWILMAATVSLVVFGLFMLYAATHTDTNISTPYYYVKSQAVGLVLGLIFVVVLTIVNYRVFARYQRYIYGLILLLLVLTLVAGAGAKGATRWIDLGFIRLQTSELAKILLIVSLGAFLAEGAELRYRFRFVVLSVCYILVPTLLVFLQPDLGTAMVFFAVLTVMLVVWGIRMKHLTIYAGVAAGVGVLVLRVLPAMGVHVLKGYQWKRLTIFLHPETDKKVGGFQLIQSKIAIGSGMFSGKGYLSPKATQTQLNFLPEHHTDFIFAVVGEQLGFVGSAILLGLFAIIIWRAFRISRLSEDKYGSLIAAGIAGLIAFEVFVNVGMTIGIMPVTGIPLPFVSFGSSSLVVFLMAVGLLQSIHVHSVAGRAR